MWLKKFLLYFVMLLLVVGLYPPSLRAAPLMGDGLTAYGEGVVTTPRYRQFSKTTSQFAAELSLPAAAATIRYMDVEASPTRDEVIAAVVSTTGTLYVYRWNGTAWAAQWNVAIGNWNVQGFDVAYEQASGDAVVMYTGNVATTNEIRYRVWNGTVWTGATNYNAVRTTGIVHSIKLASSPGSDDLGVVWGDANMDVSANYWVGSTDTMQTEPAAVLSANVQRIGNTTPMNSNSIDVAFESTSKDMLVAWGENNTADLSYRTRTPGAGGAWSAATVVEATAREAPTDIELSPDPDSDYIGYVNVEDGQSDADGAIWTGTAWQNAANIDITADTVGASTKNISSAWVRSGSQSRMVVVYDDANAAGIDWVFYNKNTNAWSPAQTDYTGAPAAVGTDDKLIRVYANPYRHNEALILQVDNASDLFLKKIKFNGTTFSFVTTETGGVVYENTVSSITGRAADFAYYKSVDPGSLSLNLVTNLGATIPAPSIPFPAEVFRFTCTNSVATPANIYVRVQNLTQNALWSVTIAPTAGPTAVWQGTGPENYDINDGGGAPAGCADSGDADSVAGRLTIDPSAATFTGQTECNTEGLNNGALASFNQGVTDSILLASSSSISDLDCYWDMSSNVTYTQTLPAETPASSYSSGLTLTVLAS